ncbi:ribosomal protein L7/L12 [Kitasatospora herbaricolor]|uniref:Ribosomal protein L7/L12 n=1 Tax=Kitasatospora herbaricolor TaxID=68217 RepID=A0ABZ1WFD7_9ACTN|nr:ribosomal protein L7/L12 [Kitasatospora herbaricolor]
MDTALIVVLVLVVALGLLFSGMESRLRRMDRRLTAMDRRLGLIIDHLGAHPGDGGPEPALQRVAALLRDGKKIHAIKAYREITGADLREAKEAVERMAEGR